MPPSRFDPTAPLPGPPEPWASTSTARPSGRTAVPHDRDDRGRTGARRADPRPARRARRRRPPSSPRRSGRRSRRCPGHRDRLRDVASTRRSAPPRSCARRCAPPGSRVPIVRGRSRRSSSSLDPPTRGLVIGVSHEGGTAATNAALARGPRGRGADGAHHRQRRSPGAARSADIVVETAELDQSWCHTVGYVSPLLAAAAVGAHAVGPAAWTPTRSSTLLAAGTRDEAGRGADRRPRSPTAAHLLVVASGADRPAGRELVAQGRGGGLAAVRVPRPRDVPPRPPAGDRRGRPGLVLILTDRAAPRRNELARARRRLACRAGHRDPGARRSSPADLDAGTRRRADAGRAARSCREAPEPARPGRRAVRHGDAAPAR